MPYSPSLLMHIVCLVKANCFKELHYRTLFPSTLAPWFYNLPVKTTFIIRPLNLVPECAFFYRTMKPVLWDHCRERPRVLKTTYFLQKVPHFNTIEPVTKDPLSWETTFLCPKGWSFKTCSALNLYFKTSSQVRPPFQGSKSGLKTEGLLYL